MGWNYSRVYGITQAQYDEMLEKQNGKCAICNNPDEVEDRKLAIDHCHTTGRIRGLLCGKCNRGLGFIFKDNPDLLLKAISYFSEVIYMFQLNGQPISIDSEVTI